MEVLVCPMIGVLLVVVVPLAVVVAIYNGLVRVRQHVRESWSGIDTELKRRYELIPNLVATVKGYAAHEQQTLEAVIAARHQAMAAHHSVAEQAGDENQLVRGLGKLIALSERYPELKASEHFLSLQRELSNTEDRIQAARRFYNANVRDLNTRIESFPSNLVAGLFRFHREDFFEVEHLAIRAAPQVGL